MKHEYDYIVVGGGSAGCALAARLSEDADISVLLIEAGPRGGGLFDFWKIGMPAAFDHIWRNPKYNWMYEGEPEPTLLGRTIFQSRGRVLGGSSTINGMCFVRGHALDFERWVDEGAAGWSWNEVLPYFKRIENWEGGESEYRGGSGPMHVRFGSMRCPLYESFLSAGEQAGYGISNDINGANQEGFAAFQMNVDQGVRASSAHAYIRPNTGRANLTVSDRSMAERLIITGNRAAGVRYRRAGAQIDAIAHREVILASGAIGSPQLLMLSGIGPAEHLAQHGIVCINDLPGVGNNLQNHPLVYITYSIDKPLSLSSELRPDRMLATGARWLVTHGGSGASNNVETCAFMRSDSSVPHPDVELQFIPVVVDDTGTAMKNIHGFTYCIGATRVEAAGWVKLRSDNPADAPRIFSNFLSTDRDLAVMRRAVDMAREVASQRAYAGLGVTEIGASDKYRSMPQMEAYLRENVSGDFHLTSSCKMGTDRMAVVDSLLKVQGIERLRIADASVMPSIVSANTNATTIMIAEKAADMVLGRMPLPKSSAVLPR